MKVSICMITYNHERYISQAIESVLMQQIDVPYEIIIGEDCSSDRTREIIASYQRKHPDIIVPLFPRENQGFLRNFTTTLRRCRGEYVALLEGDDYWTDPTKLQQQIRHLDAHQGCAVCFHNATAIYEDNSQAPHTVRPRGQKPRSTFIDLLVENFIPTPSVMFRNRLFDEFPEWFFKLKMGDWPLHILNAQYGTVDYMNRNMAVYRIHSGGAILSAGRLAMEHASIGFLARMNEYLHYEHDPVIRTGMARRYGELALVYARNGDQKSASACIARYISLSCSGKHFSLWHFSRILFGVYSPGLYRLLRPLKRRILD